MFPDRPAAEQVLQVGREHRHGLGLRGPLHRSDRLHLTLLGVHECVGPIQEPYLVFYRSVGAAIRQAAFDVTLSAAGSFPRKDDNRPFVMLGDERIGGAMALHRAIVGEIVSRLENPRLPRAFIPHVTMLYDARHVPERPVEPITWTAREFALIESWQGRTKYIVRGRWPLA